MPLNSRCSSAVARKAARPATSLLQSIPGRALVALIAGFLLAGALVGPAFAILPAAAPIAVGVINGFRVVAPLVAGGAARSLPLRVGVPPLTPSAAGVVGTLGVLTAAQTAANFRPRNGDHPQLPGADSIPATLETQSATPVTDTPQAWFKAVCSPGCAPASTELAACNAPGVVASIQAGNPTLTGIAITGVGAYPQGRACEWSYDGGSWRFPLVQPIEWCPTANAAASGGVCPTAQQCPSGFTLNGTMCERYTCPPSLTLTGPLCVGERYPADQTPTLRPAVPGPGWEPDPLDPDVPNPLDYCPTCDVVINGIDFSGNPARVSIQPTPDGGMRVTTEIQHNTGGNTQTSTSQVTISPTGQVGQPITSNSPGAMPSAPPTTLTPGSTNVPGSNGEGTPTEFPEDYARQNRQCGYPGGPKCDVKIDETATPTGADALKGSREAIEKAATDAATSMQAAASAEGKDTSWGLTFDLPSSCEPFVMWDTAEFGAMEIDMCQWQPIIHDLLSMVWAAATVFAVAGMVFRTVNGSA